MSVNYGNYLPFWAQNIARIKHMQPRMLIRVTYGYLLATYHAIFTLEYSLLVPQLSGLLDIPLQGAGNAWVVEIPQLHSLETVHYTKRGTPLCSHKMEKF
jgi:hypothetical protein